MNRSAKRPSSSNSGASGKSKKTGTSSPGKSSSSGANTSSDLGRETAKTVQALRESFRLEPDPAGAEIVRVKGLLEAAEARLGRFRQMQVPTIALLRTGHLQRLRREQRHIGQLQDYLRVLQTK